MEEILRKDLEQIEIDYNNYHNSDDGEGYHLEELNREVYLLLKNGEKYFFPISQLIFIDYNRQKIFFHCKKAKSPVAFTEIKRIV